MKKQTRIIIGIIFLGITLLCNLLFLPEESELYLKSDILHLRKSLLPISIILSIFFAFVIIFNKTEFNDGKWSKAIYIGYIGMMSYLIFGLTSDLLTTVVLKTNRVSKTETLKKNFVISTFTITTNGTISESGPWIIKSDNKYEVRGRFTGKSYDENVDGIFMNINEYDKIEKKKEFDITIKNGLFGIPYEPKVSE